MYRKENLLYCSEQEMKDPDFIDHMPKKYVFSEKEQKRTGKEHGYEIRLIDNYAHSLDATPVILPKEGRTIMGRKFITQYGIVNRKQKRLRMYSKVRTHEDGHYFTKPSLEKRTQKRRNKKGYK